MNPIHPRNIKKGMKLFNLEGNQESVMDIVDNAGRYTWTTHFKQEGSAKNHFHTYEFDVHIYNDDPNPLPELYKKNPKGGKR